MSKIDDVFQPVFLVARRLGLAEAWLKREAKEGRIPALKVANNRFLLNIDAVEKALFDRAQAAMVADTPKPEEQK